MRMMILTGSLVLTLGLAAGAWADEPLSTPLVTDKPVKVTAKRAVGSIFRHRNAVKSTTGPDGATTDVLLLRSTDHRVEMGLYQAGPSEQDIASYGDDEFMFVLEGSVTLTSVDGTVLVVRSGEGVAMPKGWKGHWSTRGYKKYYVTYADEAAAK